MAQIRRFRFQTKYMKALQAFMAKNDVRFYLNGLLITPHPEKNGVLLVATDGNRLVAIHDTEGQTNGEYIICPSKNFFREATKNGRVRDPLTVPNFIESFGDTLVLHAESHALEDFETAQLNFTKNTITADCCETVQGEFPDFSRVLNADLKPMTKPLGINPNYLADLHHLSPDCSKYPHVSMMTTGENNAIYFRSVSNPECFATVMPVRGDTYNLKSFKIGIPKPKKNQDPEQNRA